MALPVPRPARQPAIYLPHGGGPWPFVDLGGLVPRRDAEVLRAYLEGLPATLPSRPRALLVVSAHWEEAVPTVMSGERPPMLYDYSGFPPEAYRLQWPAPGSPALAARVQELLRAAGIASAADPRRGFDHGTFVPLLLSWPRAELPAVQLSLARGLDPGRHLAIGRALSPLRDEGVLILGSGMSYHNLRVLLRGGDPGPDAERFDAWLRAAATAPPPERARLLERWDAAPAARAAHPREEHLLPLMVVAGAAGDDAGRVPFSAPHMGARVSAVHYG